MASDGAAPDFEKFMNEVNRHAENGFKVAILTYCGPFPNALMEREIPEPEPPPERRNQIFDAGFGNPPAPPAEPRMSDESFHAVLESHGSPPIDRAY
jgi:hypothetical protein